MCQRLIRFFTLAALLCLGALTATAASSFVVNNTNDSGAGSLRKAIDDANANPGADNIYFLIISGSGVRTIAPSSPLPAITDPVTISGYTQPGSSVNTLSNGNNAVLRIELDGGNAGVTDGLIIEAAFCQVRGLVINRFEGSGLVVADTSDCLIEGNFIGTDATGATAAGNGADGIVLYQSSSNIIRGNVICANTDAGIYVEGQLSRDNRIRGNWIGLDASGATALGNDTGVYLDDAPGNLIGGTNAGAGNVIAYNANGVTVASAGATNNSVLGNSIFLNDGLGLDLGDEGVTLNDAGDADTGPNQRQNFPVLAYATSAGSTTVHGTLNSAANTAYRLEFFASPTADPSGYGEGQIFLGAASVTTDNGGNASFTVPLDMAASSGMVVTATATDSANNTSEFSQAVTVSAAIAISSLSATSGAVGTTITISGTNFSTESSKNIVYFGTVRAQIISTSATQLVVRVPVGATYAPVSVTAEGLTAFARVPFSVTFDVVRGLDTNSFASPTHYPLGPFYDFRHAIGDFNADGKTDLLVADASGNSNVLVFQNRSIPGRLDSNSFALPVRLVSGSLVSSLAVADFDGDGLLDFAVGNYFGNSVSMFRNTGYGTDLTTNSFALSVDFATPPTPCYMAVGDMDGDGRVDLVVATGGSLVVLQNQSSPGALTAGSFTASSNLDSYYSGAPLLADLDGDGKLDIATFRSGQLRLLRNLSSPGILSSNSFVLEATLPLTSYAPNSYGTVLAAGDLDGDGRPDLALAAADGYDNRAVIVFRNQSVPGSLSSNAFTDRFTLQVGLQPSSVAIADLDGDGKPELAVADHGIEADELTISAFLNISASGTSPEDWFSPRVSFITGAGPTTIFVADFDGDGKPDLSTAAYGPTTVSLLRNTQESICVPPPSGLVAWWRAENNALDAVGTNHGTLINGASFAAGEVGQGFLLHGYDHVEVADSPDLYPGTNSFTVDAWIKTTSAASGHHYIVSRYEGGGADTTTNGALSFYGLYLENGRLAGVLRDADNGTNANDQKVSGTSLVADGNWHHVALVRDMTIGKMKLFLDGAMEADAQLSGLANGAISNDDGLADPFVIGANRLGNSNQFVSFFTGVIDEVGYVSRALSLNELAAIFAAGSAGKCPPGLAGRPVVRVNGVYHPDNNAIAMNSALIEMQSSFSGGSIRYTLDGSPPAGGILYTGVFELKHPALVRAIAYAADFSSSAEADAVLVDVVVPPFIITQPFGRTVGSGAEVSLSVVAGGTAPLSYEWRRNGVAVPAATDSTLLLSSIEPIQGGDYTVVITNDYGAITSVVATVVVFAPPSFLNQPVSVTVTVGGTATFSVSALGPPPLEFQWRKNGANILGAINSTLTIANVQFDDGASYSVVVASPGGTLVSTPALLVVTVPSPAAGDNFASTNTLPGASGSASGTNNFATREVGEPLHAGKPGSNSVWYSWTAPAKGIATFRTTGSTFDTLLGIYTGTNAANLRTIVSDEDGGGFLASRASFNASNGVTYHVAIDGLNGQQGGYVLRWELVATDDLIPQITCPPASLTVLPGQDATFTVGATGPSLGYQWLLNGTNIAGATNSLYTRTNTRPEHVGFCSVRVTSASGQTVESAPALLELGLDPGVQSRDKPDDVDATCPGAFAPAAGASSVAMGSVGYQILVSSSTNNQIDCNTANCGGIPTGTRYLELQPSASGTFLIDTVGSASRTKLWVCKAGTNNLDRTRTYLTCDVDTASDGRSLVSFNADSGRTYQVWISKLDNTNGVLQLNWKLGLPPRITSLSSNRFVLEGTTTTLSVSATNIIAAGVDAANALKAPIYTWYFNGPTPVATGPTLDLNNLKASDAGQYLVVARNEVGMTSAVVRVEIFGSAEVAVVNSGGMTELFADATTAGCDGAAARYQWRLNGAMLTGKTNRSLILQGTQPTQAGQYSVTVSNCFGATTYVTATLAVTVDVGFTAAIVGGQVVLQWQTTPGKHYRVEHRATPDGVSWSPLQPDLTAATSSLTVVDPLGTVPRFYRIVLLD